MASEVAQSPLPEESSVLEDGRDGYMLQNGEFVSKEEALSPSYLDASSSPWVSEKTVRRKSSEEEFRRQIEEAAKHTPRYLFRFWSKASGGHQGLNQATSIMPLAFLNGRGPESIFDIPRQLLASLAFGHFCGRHIQSVFSSWSQSLGICLTMAHSVKQEDIHISILDTARLPDHNIILHVPEMNRFISSSIPYGFHEFLAFGIIDGAAFSSVSLDTLLRNGLSTLLREGIGREICDMPGKTVDFTLGPASATSLSAEQVISAAIDAAGLFDEDFDVPVVAHLMSLRGRSADKRQYFVECLAAYSEPPYDWEGDLRIMRHGYAIVGDYQETKQAIRILREVAQMAQD